ELRPTVAPGESEAKRLQIAADRLQLPDDRPRLEARLDELAEARERLRRVDVGLDRLEHELRVLPFLDEIPRTPQHRRRRDRHPDALRQLLVAQSRKRLG